MIEEYGICQNKDVIDVCYDCCHICKFYKKVTKEIYDKYDGAEKIQFFD